MARIKNISIPFGKNGNLLSKVERSPRYDWRTKTTIDNTVSEWKNNFSFYASMKYVGIDKGPYSDRMTFEDQDTGKRYNMHMNDFINVVEFMRFGIVQGTFCFTRSHGKYGVRLLP